MSDVTRDLGLDHLV